MVLLCKQKALYVKACIIANGVTDSQGDTLYTEDIKKIFTSFNNQDNFDVYHNGIPLTEVSLLENYISNTDETIGTAVVPRGSWNAVIRVDNPEIQQSLLNNTFQGVSLDNRIAESCKANLKGIIRYKDIPDTECVIPLYISFVEGGANGYGLHVLDYDAYIKKSKDIVIEDKGANNMAFDLLNGLKNLIKQAEEDNDESTPEIIKEEAPKKEKEEDETKPVIEKEDKPVKEEETATKEEEDDSDFEAKVTEIVEKILAKKEEETKEKEEEEEETKKEEKEEEENEDTPKITKSRKVLNNDTQSPQNANYFEVTGRDPVTGVKIRK